MAFRQPLLVFSPRNGLPKECSIPFMPSLLRMQPFDLRSTRLILSHKRSLPNNQTPLCLVNTFRRSSLVIRLHWVFCMPGRMNAMFDDTVLCARKLQPNLPIRILSIGLLSRRGWIQKAAGIRLLERLRAESRQERVQRSCCHLKNVL